MILLDRRLIVVHIQKTGGSSISAALGLPDNPPEKHRTALELKDLYGEPAWSHCFKFAVVRNPWDRLVSWWSMIDGRRSHFESGRPVSRFQRYILTRASTFGEFLTNCGGDIADPDGNKSIWRNQIDYITDRHGALMVDRIGRFERLGADWRQLTSRRFESDVPLPHVNVSAHRHYTTYYTPELAELIGRRYARDIAAFGYAFRRPAHAAPVARTSAAMALERSTPWFPALRAHRGLPRHRPGQTAG